MGVSKIGTPPCVLVLGGSFDPVHAGHIALAKLFCSLLQPDQLRIVPAGNPWQKTGLAASAEDRVKMLQLAFAGMPIVIDRQEIVRTEQRQGNYSVDTLRNLRQELGPNASLVFLIGADQLQNLHTWRRWRDLFDYAHVCAASRPGFGLAGDHVASEVAEEFTRRTATPEQIRQAASGLCYLAEGLNVDISATQIRADLKHGGASASLPGEVLDYIQLHHLYQ